MSSAASDREEKPTNTQKPNDGDDYEYPSSKKRIIIMTALYLAIFLVTLDQNIISTALPRITDEFDSLDDVGWYGTAYILTLSSFQLLMGKIYKFYPAKPTFLIGCILFELGSVVCGAAPNSNAFIVGRAIAGLGSAGIFSGVLVIIFYTIPLHQRPIYQGAFGAVFAVASVVGPLIGGAFTDDVTWRWCFYINLPVGAISIVVTIFMLQLSNQKLDPQAEGWIGKLKQLDPIGNLAFFPGIVSLVLALQWGGTQYSWENARIVVLLILCVVLCITFMAIQIWKKEEATVPPRIVMKRSVAAAIWFGFFSGASLLVVLYYLPIYFQAIKGVSAVRSGIMLLPMVLSTVIGSIGSGIIISRVGYYTPFFLLASVILPIGCGLFTTFSPSTGHAKWIGYQVIFGFGAGIGSQQPLNVVQTVLDRSDVATGTAVILFVRFLGSAIFLPIGQTIFLNTLVSKLSNLSGINTNAITNAGATELRDLATGGDLTKLLSDYNAAIINVFYLTTAAAAVTIIGSVFVEWHSMTQRSTQQKGHSDVFKPEEQTADV